MHSVKNIVRRAFSTLGFEIIRKSTHRGINLETDLLRIIGCGPHTFIDAGANIGNVSAQFLEAFPSATIYAFEPCPETFAKLSSRGHERINPICAALGATPGMATLKMFSEEPGWNRITGAGSDGQETTQVEMTTVDRFCQERGLNKIALLKTDCEGYDENVVRGADRMLRENRIKAVYCEVNFLRNGANGDFFAIHEHLSERDMIFYALYDYSGPQAPTTNFTNALWIQRP